MRSAWDIFANLPITYGLITMYKYIYLLVSLLILPNLFADQVINTSIANEWPNERYKVHGDGTVTDTATGLMWLRCSLGQDLSNSCSGSATNYNWEEALEAADNYVLNSYTDWRLPNIKELDSLIALDRYDPAINSTVFPNTPSSQYWSASPSPIVTSGCTSWQHGFNYGYDYDVECRDNNYHVRLVRSGQ